MNTGDQPEGVWGGRVWVSSVMDRFWWGDR